MGDLTPIACACVTPIACACVRFVGNERPDPHCAQAIVGASMRKLVHLIYGVLKSGEPFKAEIPMAGLEIQEGI